MFTATLQHTSEACISYIVYKGLGKSAVLNARDCQQESNLLQGKHPGTASVALVLGQRANLLRAPLQPDPPPQRRMRSTPLCNLLRAPLQPDPPPQKRMRSTPLCNLLRAPLQPDPPLQRRMTSTPLCNLLRAPLQPDPPPQRRMRSTPLRSGSMAPAFDPAPQAVLDTANKACRRMHPIP